MILKENNESHMSEKKFSIILNVHNCEMHLEESINSIINQDIGFEDNIQLILANNASDDASFDIALDFEKKYPENILVISQDYYNISSMFNLAKKYVTGQYVNFMDGLDKLDSKALKIIENSFLNNDVGIIYLPVIAFGIENFNKRQYELKGLIDLNEHPDKYINFLYPLFFKKDIIDDLFFEDKLNYSYDLLFTSKALLKSNKYLLLKEDTSYYFRSRSISDKDLIEDKDYYITQIKYFIKELADYTFNNYNNVPEFIKFILIRNMVRIIKDREVNTILDDNELKDFFDCLKHTISYFTNEELIDISNYLSNSGFFIAVKQGDITFENIKNNKLPDKLKLKVSNSQVCLYSYNQIIDDLSQRDIFLDFITLRDGKLSFSGLLKSNFSLENISISAIREFESGKVEIIDATYYDYPTRSTSTMMGFDWEFAYNFDLTVPSFDEKEKSAISLVVNYKHGNQIVEIQSPIIFRKYCNMSYTSHYYVKDNKIIMYNGKFNIMPYSYLKMFKYEIRGLLKILKDRDFFFKQALFFRVLYLILYPFMRNKEIWIIMDRKLVADDNAEHFYKYALKQDDEIKKFFSIQKESPDFNRLQETYGNVLEFESIKHRFYYTFADKIISSQGSEFYLNPFRNRRYYQTAGISNIDFYFLQHGIIKDNMSSWLRKYDRNPKLIVTSTELEYKSLFDEGYNYGTDVIQLLGLPRYDNLDNKGYRKQIVIMPSWRNFLKDEKMLLESEYFNRFNSLINNKRLIKHAKDKGYDIIFKPHPELVRYLDLFDKNDYVEIDELKKYQVIFNESALLITDYSSIFFDFSYLKKPLIYYQYGNDYHYDSDNGYFQYDTMGFGPVIAEEEELVDKIIEYMDNDCVMEDFYKKRVDDFFKYHDHNNSKRCYDWIYNH